MKAMGVGMAMRNLASVKLGKNTFTQIIAVDGDKIDMEIVGHPKGPRLQQFTVGAEFDETTPRGLPTHCTTSFEGGKLTVVAVIDDKGKTKTVTMTRYLDGGRMFWVAAAPGGVEWIRTFEKDGK